MTFDRWWLDPKTKSGKPSKAGRKDEWDEVVGDMTGERSWRVFRTGTGVYYDYNDKIRQGIHSEDDGRVDASTFLVNTSVRIYTFVIYPILA